MNELTTYAPLFRRFAEGIVYKPSQMTINEAKLRPDATKLFVRVHPDDIGVLCGGQGVNIKAFQAIFKRIGALKDQYVGISVDKLQNVIGTGAPSRVFIQDWDRQEEACEMVRDYIEAMGWRCGKVTHDDHGFDTIITAYSDIDGRLFDALGVVLEAWGKSLGRKLILTKPDQISIA